MERTFLEESRLWNWGGDGQNYVRFYSSNAIKIALNFKFM